MCWTSNVTHVSSAEAIELRQSSRLGVLLPGLELGQNFQCFYDFILLLYHWRTFFYAFPFFLLGRSVPSAGGKPAALSLGAAFSFFRHFLLSMCATPKGYVHCAGNIWFF